MLRMPAYDEFLPNEERLIHVSFQYTHWSSSVLKVVDNAIFQFFAETSLNRVIKREEAFEDRARLNLGIITFNIAPPTNEMPLSGSKILRPSIDHEVKSLHITSKYQWDNLVERGITLVVKCELQVVHNASRVVC